MKITNSYYIEINAEKCIQKHEHRFLFMNQNCILSTVIHSVFINRFRISLEFV